ncbi:MAG: chloride channel protein [Deltaproteobacteria bacterium]|nr:chloride channel protein [Deltaproteobacteria bacterium]
MSFSDGIRRFRQDQATQLILTGLLIGVLSGVAAVLYRWLIAYIQSLFFGGGEDILEVVQSASFWRRILMPALGGLLVGIISKILLKKEGASHGVPDVMEAFQGNKPLPRRVILVRALTSAITIGSGGSSGREGPIVHIGATIGSAVSRLLKKKGELVKTMISCGAAGGIAATFNAPITGALFALEIIHGDVAIRHFTPVVISAVIATVVSNSLLHGQVADFPALTNGQFSFALKSGGEIPLYLLMALFLGGAGILFIRLLEGLEESFEKIKMPGYLKPALGGFLLAWITLFLPQLHGFSNYTTINQIFEGQYLWYVIALMGLLKMLTTSLTLGSGGTGGVFAPSLFVGAMLGDTYGYFAHKIFPNATADAGSYALVGMGALMAAVTGAPLTSVVLIFELSGKYTIILPLMITCAVSTILVQIVMKGSVFTRPLIKKGIFYGEKRNVLRRMRVQEILRTNFLSVTPQTKVKELLNLLTQSKQYAFPVLDDGKNLVGIVSLQDFQGAVFEQGLSDIVVVGELMTSEVLTVTPEQSLEEALLKIGDENIEYLPVLVSGDSKQVLGIVSRRDILSCYNREVKEMIEAARTE